MAQEKARAPRARKTTKGETGAAAETKATKPSAAKKVASTEKTSARATAKRTQATSKKTAAAPAKTTRKPATKASTARTRSLAAVAQPTPEQIAERAYLLWQSGEPGDQTEHWLRAEAELRAA
ncbi:MAG: DUF2934 domain-containing protein [Gaiella sp.]